MPAQSQPRERLLFNADWRFMPGDPVDAIGKLDYAKIKDWVTATGSDLAKDTPAAKPRPTENLGGDVSYTQPGFDDSGWRQLNLPHDWGIEGPFQQEYPGETGKLPWWGIGWYRKHFTVSAGDQGRQFYLDVDGAMAYANVWLNGQFVGGWPYGYASWRARSHAVHQARRGKYPRHPSGQSAGFLALVSGRRHLPQCLAGENRARPRRPLGHLCHHAGSRPESRHGKPQSQRGQSFHGRDADVKVTTQIYRAWRRRREGGMPVGVAPADHLEYRRQFSGHRRRSTRCIRNPKLWSLRNAHPLRRRHHASNRTGKVVDRYETPFGIRTIKFTADNGFLLNGERVRLNGVCDHHDLGRAGFGASTPARWSGSSKC